MSNTLLMSKFFQVPAPNFPWFISKWIKFTRDYKQALHLWYKETTKDPYYWNQVLLPF